MGIYINMEMPEKIEPGLVIEFAEGIDGKRYARLHHYRYGGMTDWLEAFPVPKHGRLIDADALVQLFKEKAAEHGGLGGIMVALAAACVDAAPTIIAADEGE